MLKKILRFLPHIITILIVVVLIILSKYIPYEDIQSFITDAGIWAPIIYILVMIIGQIFAPISTAALFAAGFYLFGNWVFLYSFIIGMAASIINFTIARKFGWVVVRKLVGDKGSAYIERLLDRFGNKSLYVIRILSFTVNDFMSYAFGFTSMKFFHYLIATFISQVLWIALWQIFFRSGVNSWLEFILILALTAVPMILFLYWYLWKRK